MPQLHLWTKVGRAAWESRVHRQSLWVLAGKMNEEKLILKSPKGEEILKAQPLLQETELWTVCLQTFAIRMRYVVSLSVWIPGG